MFMEKLDFEGAKFLQKNTQTSFDKTIFETFLIANFALGNDRNLRLIKFGKFSFGNFQNSYVT